MTAQRNFAWLALLVPALEWLATQLGTALAFYAATAAAEEAFGADDEEPPSTSFLPAAAIDAAHGAIAQVRSALAADSSSTLGRLALKLASDLERALSGCVVYDPAHHEETFAGLFGGGTYGVCDSAATEADVRAAVGVMRSHATAALGGPLPAIRVAGVAYGDEATQPEPQRVAPKGSALPWLVAAVVLWGVLS